LKFHGIAILLRSQFFDRPGPPTRDTIQIQMYFMLRQNIFGASICRLRRCRHFLSSARTEVTKTKNPSHQSRQTQRRGQRTNCQPRSSTTRKTRDIFDTFDGLEVSQQLTSADKSPKMTSSQTNVAARVRRALPCVCGQNQYNIDQSPGNATSTLEGPLRHASTSQTAAAKGTSALQLQVLLCHVTCDPVTSNASAKICGLPYISSFSHHLSSVICHLSSVICIVTIVYRDHLSSAIICHLSSTCFIGSVLWPKCFCVAPWRSVFVSASTNWPALISCLHRVPWPRVTPWPELRISWLSSKWFMAKVCFVSRGWYPVSYPVAKYFVAKWLSGLN
jgi:hypothetical protein